MKPFGYSCYFQRVFYWKELSLRRKMRYMSTITIKARLILYNQGKILLLRQKKRNGGNFTLVGGTMEEDETPMECLIRESQEEAGIILKEEDLRLVHVLHKQTNKGKRITLYFKAHRWEGKLRSREPEKFSGVQWHHLYELPSNLTNTVKHVLSKYRGGIYYSEFSTIPTTEIF